MRNPSGAAKALAKEIDAIEDGRVSPDVCAEWATGSVPYRAQMTLHRDAIGAVVEARRYSIALHEKTLAELRVTMVASSVLTIAAAIALTHGPNVALLGTVIGIDLVVHTVVAAHLARLKSRLTATRARLDRAMASLYGGPP